MSMSASVSPHSPRLDNDLVPVIQRNELGDRLDDFPVPLFLLDLCYTFSLRRTKEEAEDDTHFGLWTNGESPRYG